jgi:hypothetical protein
MITNINKITGVTAVLLATLEDNVDVTHLSFVNIHLTDAAVIDLYLTDDTDTYYILKKVTLPIGVSLHVDGFDLDFDKELYNLYVKLGASSSTVDVITRY